MLTCSEEFSAPPSSLFRIALSLSLFVARRAGAARA